jgi:acyl-homoserine-lactone acylase
MVPMVQRLLLACILTLTCCAGLFAQNPSIDPARIEIIRDSFGVPHIFAPTDAEVAYGLAWAHAEDDFPSIFQNLMLARARLGEMLGVEGAKMDFFAHFTGARKVVRERFATDVSPAYQKVMQGYVDGLTAYSKAHPQEVKLRNVLPFTTEDLETAFAITFCAMSGAPYALQAVMAGKPFRSPISWGSNGFAVSPLRSDNGETFLVNDPHWLTDGPLTFYEVHLESQEGWQISGGCYPGTPMPVNAVNRQLGWNLPFNFPDLIDIYRLTVNPEDKYQYWMDGRWEDFEVEKVPLKVKTGVGKLTVKREILWCKYGPAIRTDEGVYAFRLYPMDVLGAGEQLYRMGKARNYGEFQAAMKMQRMPLFNVVYADGEGNIEYVYNAKVPRRDTAWNWNEVMEGNTSGNYWTEYWPYESLPHVRNPRCGYVYNMNSSPYQCTCPAENPLSPAKPTRERDFFDPENDRSIRFREWMEGRGKISYADLKAIKFDLLYPMEGGAIRMSWERICQLNPEKYPDLKAVLAMIAQAELRGNKDNRHTALFTFAMYHLIETHKPNMLAFLENGLTLPEADVVASLRHAQKVFLKQHGRIDPKLEEVQVLQRGDERVGVMGLPQNLNSTECDMTKEGLLKVNRNSSFLQMVRFTANGPIIESIVPYGSSNRKGTKHYADQMDLHCRQGFKRMEWNRDVLLRQAERVYHPE